MKRQYRGDPGLFGFIGKAIGGVAKIAGSIIPGPIGGIAKLVSGALSSAGKPVNPSIAAKPLPASVMSVLTASNVPQLPQFPQQIGLVNTQNVTSPGVGMVPYAPPGTVNQSGLGAGASTNGAGCQSGYHRNKTGYFTKKYGWIPQGSVCVKNRKRNPLNPRALSRSMARLSSAQCAASFLNRVTIAPRKKKGCGCR